MITPEWTKIVLGCPWLVVLGFAVLDGLDYYLTLVGARFYRRGAHRVLDYSGSYELNPYFQRSIDEGRWLPPRVVRTLLVGAVLYGFVTWSLGRRQIAGELGRQVLAGLLGLFLFTRLTVIGQHLQNIWLFGHILRDPAALRGRLAYNRPTIVRIASYRFLSIGLVLTVAGALAPSAWLWGGAAGHILLALQMRRWSPRRAPAPATMAPVQDETRV